MSEFLRLFQYFVWFSLTFPVCFKFPDFSMIRKRLPIFPGFPVRVGTLFQMQLVACPLYLPSASLARGWTQGMFKQKYQSCFFLSIFWRYFALGSCSHQVIFICHCPICQFSMDAVKVYQCGPSGPVTNDFRAPRSNLGDPKEKLVNKSVINILKIFF